MTVRTYWAWETTVTFRLLGGAQGAGAPTGEEDRGGSYLVATRTASAVISYAQYSRRVVSRVVTL